MSAFITDIETVPTAAALSTPYPKADRSPPSNYKNADAIDGWYMKDEAGWRADRAKQCALDPRLGRVIAIGRTDADRNVVVGMANEEADERDLLCDWWHFAAQAGGSVVTFNGTFDLRFLVVRSLVHRILPTVSPRVIRDWFRRYTVRPHFDCRAVLTNWDMRTEGTLTEWGESLGITTEAVSGCAGGAEVFDAYQRGDFLAIRDHCQHDVETTAALYERLAPMFGDN